MNGLDQFEAIVQRFGKVAGLALGGTALLPIITAASGLAPSWPDGLSFLASILMLLTLAMVFHFLTVRNRRIFSAVFLTGGLLFLAAMTTHVYLYSSFTTDSVQGDEQLILGCGWKADTIEYARATGIDASDQCPGDFRSLLEESNGDPAQVFTPSGIMRNAFAMAASWLAMFVSLALVLGAFVIWYAERPGRGAPGRKSGQAAR